MIYPPPVRSASVAALLLTCCGGAAAPAAAPRAASFDWPVPAKWKHETIPFPLDFAPDLAYRGTEELRFAPGFFDPSAPGYWSYAFVWWVDQGPPFDAPSVSAALKQYFVGLTKAVAGDAKEKWEPDLARIDVRLDPQMNGTVTTIDAFKTHAPVALVVKAQQGTCGDHRYLLVSASPKPPGDPMWTALDRTTTGFRCR